MTESGFQPIGVVCIGVKPKREGGVEGRSGPRQSAASGFTRTSTFGARFVFQERLRDTFFAQTVNFGPLGFRPFFGILFLRYF